jgi:hypothetical protein
MVSESPRNISVDDHIVEPQNLWQERLPAKYRDRGPRVERHYGYLEWNTGGKMDFVDDDNKSNPKSRWCDHWVYDDLRWPLPAGFASVGPVQRPGSERGCLRSVQPKAQPLGAGWTGEARRDPP